MLTAILNLFRGISTAWKIANKLIRRYHAYKINEFKKGGRDAIDDKDQKALHKELDDVLKK